MQSLVAYNTSKVAEVHLQELGDSLTEMVAAEPAAPVADTLAYCKAQKVEWALPDGEILKVGRGGLGGHAPVALCCLSETERHRRRAACDSWLHA